MYEAIRTYGPPRVTLNRADSNRINNFQFWQFEKDLNSWRAVSNSWRAVSKRPKETSSMLRMEVQKYVIRRRNGNPWKLLDKVEEWAKAGIKVYSCYEADACGYWYHRELIKRGALNFRHVR
jgi:hypothetical protein